MAGGAGGSLSTHVLDTATGRPAAGLALSLWRIEADGSRHELTHRITNADGRCDEPLITPEHFAPGLYEIVFEAGAYLDRLGLDLPEPKFLDQIPIRFGMSDPVHYHVPLLLSPFGYSTYRGS